MAFKRAFTLAEILIVLMTIGVIAALTIPSLMKGVVEAQLKMGYKKALHAISNIAAAEKVAGFLPSTNKSIQTMYLFQSLNSNLSVNGYVAKEISEANSGKVVKNGDYANAITIAGQKFGTGEKTAGEVTAYSITTFGASPWIVTDDNMAYSVMCGGNTGVKFQCATRQEINAQANQQEAAKKSCSIVIVDVNGLSKGPNKYEPQIRPSSSGEDNQVRINNVTTTVRSGVPLETLTGDQYIIFVGSDGATAGPKDTTVTGRIAADLK